ncbi:MAG: GNAT family N-acetyltransferase [Akkermansiaceae bacterium]
MNKEPRVRLAVKEDADNLIRFNRAMARETENKELIEEVITSGVKNLLETPHHGFYVIAEVSEEVVGSLMVTTEWSDWRNGLFWWIQSVYVLPDHRRKGIYRRLYEFVKERALEDQSICGFRLYVEKENLTAQKTYESLGMGEAGYKIYEELKENVRFLEGPD